MCCRCNGSNWGRGNGFAGDFANFGGQGRNGRRGGNWNGNCNNNVSCNGIREAVLINNGDIDLVDVRFRGQIPVFEIEDDGCPYYR